MINIKDKLLNTSLSITLGIVFLPIVFILIFTISSWGIITGLVAINIILIYLGIVFIKSGLHFLWNMVNWVIEPDPELELVKYQINRGEQQQEDYFSLPSLNVTSPTGAHKRMTLSEYVEDLIIERRETLRDKLLMDRALVSSPEPITGRPGNKR
jgi:hypothetical protein